MHDVEDLVTALHLVHDRDAQYAGELVEEDEVVNDVEDALERVGRHPRFHIIGVVQKGYVQVRQEGAFVGEDVCLERERILQDAGQGNEDHEREKDEVTQVLGPRKSGVREVESPDEASELNELHLELLVEHFERKVIGYFQQGR